MKRGLLLALAVSILIVACGGGSGPAGQPSGPVTISFWHSESAAAETNLAKLVDRFNASQAQVRVDAVYQGPPSDLALKLMAGLPSGDVPTLASMAEGLTQTLVDSGKVTPVQEYVDREGYDLSGLSSAAIAFHTIDGTLYSMPYGLLVPLLYYNRVAFRNAGLDPDRPPRDLDQVWAASERLRDADPSGTGMALDIQPWYFEAMLAAAGQPYVNNGDGREGRATAAAFDNDAGRRLFRWWHDMDAAGLLLNVGRNPSGAEQLIAVGSGRAAMTLSTSAVLRSVVDALERGVESVELGVAPLPAIPGFQDSRQTGVYSRSLWIMSSRPQAERDAAWTFIKWLLEPEQQAEWFAGSGYLPVRTAALDYPAARDIIARYPGFEVPVDVLAASVVTDPGPLLGPFPQVRAAVADGMEAMLTGNTGPDQALATAAEDADAAISDYDERLGR